MEITITYILSQIFIIISYIFLITTYYLKSRKKIIIINFAALFTTGISFLFLSAYSWMAMILLAMIRNIIFLNDEKKYGKTEKITSRDIQILIILITISIILATITYNGFLSLLSVIATMLYTVSVWQKNPKIYKILWAPIWLLWIWYNIYIMSLFWIILESIVLISAITWYILDTKKRKI